MTLVYERHSGEPGVHAFVVGIGAYPFAKPGKSTYGPNTPVVLNDVQDLASAPVGAKLFCDWLLAHADHLPAPLASVELALSAPPASGPGASDYEWKTRLGGVNGNDPRTSTAVSATDGQAIQDAGLAWATRVQALPGQIAIFYICGHGTAVPTRSFVLLSDVAGGPTHQSPWVPFIDVLHLAGAMSRAEHLRAGFVFIDACQEVISDIVLGEIDNSVSIGDTLRFFGHIVAAPVQKILLMVPAPMGQLTYDDGFGGGGRFTQVLVEALEGAAARNYSGVGDWGVAIDNLPRAMKILYSLRGWPPDGFDPMAIRSFLPDSPIVRYPTPPSVPFAVRLEPPYAMASAQLVCLRDANNTIILKKSNKAEDWIDKVQARMGLCYVHAIMTTAAGQDRPTSPTRVDLSEMRVAPPIVHPVT